jgi:hypothetical protein
MAGSMLASSPSGLLSSAVLTLETSTGGVAPGRTFNSQIEP